MYAAYSLITVRLSYRRRKFLPFKFIRSVEDCISKKMVFYKMRWNSYTGRMKKKSYSQDNTFKIVFCSDSRWLPLTIRSYMYIRTWSNMPLSYTARLIKATTKTFDRDGEIDSNRFGLPNRTDNVP